MTGQEILEAVKKAGMRDEFFSDLLNDWKQDFSEAEILEQLNELEISDINELRALV
ncbi:MAG: hypothetical protein LBI13_11245 [Streptococcaceae bacterium]|jgi:hypothetical protein|nr:hypothetical protein [Streptococcaceae bacterium]